MNNDKFLLTLGLARRANKICFGFESVVENSYAACIVFIASDSSSRTKKSVIDIMEPNNIKCIELEYTKDQIGHAIGTKPVGIVSITDDGFAKLLESKLS